MSSREHGKRKTSAEGSEINVQSIESEEKNDAKGSKFQTKRRQHNAKNLEESFEYFRENDCKMARCKLCRPESNEEAKIIKMTDSNTTGLIRHLRKFHSEAYVETYPNKVTSSESSKKVFVQGIFNKKVVDWIAKKYLPYTFFDDDDTQSLFHYLNPKAEVPMRMQLKSSTECRYNEMKKIVMDILQKNRSKIAYAVDRWTSITNRSYFGVTGHFINDNWELHSLTIFFLPSNGKHSGLEMAKVFHEALASHNITEKISGITLDNAAANTRFAIELSHTIPNFDAEDGHFKFYAHIINLSVQDMIGVLKMDQIHDGENEDDFDGIIGEDEDENLEDEKEMEFPLVKLRNLFKVLKNSEKCRMNLQTCAMVGMEMLQPNVDISVRWNSTFNMILTGTRMQSPLTLLCNLNPELISDYEWLLLTRILQYLRHFKLLSDALYGEKYVTLPLIIIGFNMLLDKLDESILELTSLAETSTVDESILEALTAAKKKLMKHYQKSNWIYCAVLILDPKHKLNMFYETPWGKEMVADSLKKFETVYRTSYYKEEETQEEVEKDPTAVNDLEAPKESGKINVFSEFKKKTLQNKSQNNTRNPKSSKREWRKEIDLYLAHECADEDQNVLEWWRQNEKLFPTLSLMARDLLCIPATSVSAERIFSRGSLTIRKHRNRLDNNSIECLMCINSWVTCSLAAQIQDLLEK